LGVRVERIKEDIEAWEFRHQIRSLIKFGEKVYKTYASMLYMAKIN